MSWVQKTEADNSLALYYRGVYTPATESDKHDTNLQ